MEKKTKSRGAWKLAAPNLYPPEHCPDAVAEYTVSGPEASNKLWKSILHKVRKHLAFLGWRIECRASHDDSLEFRYISPEGEFFPSLRQVCRNLKQTPRNMDSDSPRSSFLASQENNCDRDSFADEPEYFPEAVVYWYLHGIEKKNRNVEMKSRAKKHLLAMKWIFWYAEKAGRQELRYASPKGKVYYSLRMACKGCIDEGGVPESVLSGMNLSSCNEESSVPSQIEPSFTEISARRRTDKTPDRAANTSETVVDRDDKKVNPRRHDDQNPVNPTAVRQLSKRVRQAPQCMLARLIESNVVSPMAKVYYRGRDAPLAEGCITHDGIKCNCCNRVFQLSAFEAHAGSKNHRPAANIFLEDGRSLVDCQREVVSNNNNNKSIAPRNSCDSRKRKRHGGGDSYDVCTVCHIGGELILCDQCPATFHKGCLGLEGIPEGEWFCPSCCCGICGKGKFENTTEHFVNDDTGRVCDQCEHKFHIGCLRKSEGVVKLKNFSQNKWFCSDRCECVFSGLFELLGKPFSLGVDNLTWKLLKFMESDPSSDSELLMEIHSKLNEAVDVMHECFESVKDPLTGRDLVADVIFNRGSELKNLNFQGFYTAVLERKGEVISVATVRVFENVAEIPLVATRFRHRKHGMCRLMMDELEKQLIAVGVARLILPSAPSVLNTWTDKFGYSKITDSERLKFLNYTFLDFNGTILCQKPLMKKPPAEACKTDDVHMKCNSSSPISEVLEGETG